MVCEGSIEPKGGQMKRKYELLVLLKSDIPSEKFQSILDRIQSVVTEGGGNILLVDNWGKKKLAYEVHKNSKGVYVLFTFLSSGSIIQELERILRLNQDVMKFLTVMLEEKLDIEKEIEKAMELNKKRVEDEARRAKEEAERVAAVESAVSGDDLKGFDSKKDEEESESELTSESEETEPETSENQTDEKTESEDENQVVSEEEKPAETEKEEEPKDD